MSVELQDGGKLSYEVPALEKLGTLESITRQDVDGHRFDMTFNAGDPIPDAFSS